MNELEKYVLELTTDQEDDVPETDTLETRELEVRIQVLSRLLTERARQEKLHPGRTPAHAVVDDGLRLAILMEEVGEVARDVCEGREPTKELVEVAAVCVAWLERLLA